MFFFLFKLRHCILASVVCRFSVHYFVLNTNYFSWGNAKKVETLGFKTKFEQTLFCGTSVLNHLLPLFLTSGSMM